MPSFTTVFRAAVMLATGVLVVKGWQLYGPSAEQMKSFTARAIAVAQEALNESQQPAEPNASLTADPQGVTPPFAAPVPPPLNSDTASVTDLTPAAQVVPPVSSEPDAPPAFSRSVVDEQGPTTPDDNMPAIADADADRLPALLARLEALGGVDPQLAEWGSSGELYRFCCRAAVSDSPSFSRHFESVAAEPLVAVEEVVAKVEAWRIAQRQEGAIR